MSSIWSLEKDLRIRHLLLLLQSQLGETAFTLDTETPCHHRAIYINHRHEPGVRAYLYTLGQQADRYGVHLEFPSTYNTSQYDIHENLQLGALVDILAVHLDVATIHPLPDQH